MLEHNQELVTGEGFLVNDLTNHGIKFIEKNEHVPFLLYLPFNTSLPQSRHTHSPLMGVQFLWLQKNCLR